MKKTLAGSFIEAICGNPDEDTDHLVYADWLDDQGDADRAEFIRVQCTLGRLDPSDPAWLENRIREQILLTDHGKAWTQETPQWMHQAIEGFRRGFPSKLRITPALYARHGKMLTQRRPVEELFLWRLPRPTSVHLPLLRAFTNNSGSSAELREVLTAATNLRELTLFYPCRGEDRPAEAFRQLLETPVFGRLNKLRVSVVSTFKPEVGSLILRQLADYPLPELRRLHIFAHRLHPDHLDAILSAPFARQLQELILLGSWSALHARSLAAHELPALKILGVGDLQSVHPNLSPLLGSSLARNLRGLLLMGPTDETLRELAPENLWPQPRGSLRPGWTEESLYTPDDPFPQLRWLALITRHWQEGITLDGWRRFIRTGRLQHITQLDLDLYLPGALELFNEEAGAPQLRGFSVPSGTGLDRALLLGENPNLPRLRALAGVHAPVPVTGMHPTLAFLPTFRWVN